MKFKPRKIDSSVVEMEGWVTIETRNMKQKARNTILLQGLRQIWANINGYGFGAYGLPNIYVNIGTDVSTPTTISTTSLVSTFISSPPYMQLNYPIAYLSTDGATYWSAIISTQFPASYFTTTWIIGEIGYYTYVYPTNGSPFTTGLFSRLAVADGTISTFTVNGSTYLNINWAIEFKFGG